MSKLKTMKVLDVQWGTPKMPDDIKKSFFDFCRNNYEYLGNDIWIEYTVGNSSEAAYEYEEDEEGNEIINITGELSILDKWLISECELELGEEILLKHWW
jgi:hypothetical protein